MGPRTEAPRRAGPAAAFVLLVLLVLAIGALDVGTGPDLGMSLFYLVPVGVAAWRYGRAPGLAVGTVAAVTWLSADVLTKVTPEGVSLWNGFTRLVIFLVVALLLDGLHRERDRLRDTVERLNTERERQDALIRALSDPILVVDGRGRIVSTNDRGGALLGATGVLGRDVTEVLPFVQSGPSASEGRWTGRLSDPFGAAVEVEVSRAPIGEADASRAAVYVLHDITQHAELNRMRAQLLYSVAHELRGPLGVLENALDLISTEYGDLSAEEYERLTGSALRTVKRLRTLMEDLLSAGTIQSGRFRVVLETVPLRQILDEAVDTVQLVLAEREQHIDVDVPGAAAHVRADPRYARQVVTNLLGNASKYAPQGTPIAICAERRGGEVLVSVQDRGPGIPEDQRAGLFERFHRMRRDAAEPGVGLGLAIAKGIVEAHGGRIGVESAVGKGTTVWFTLPAPPDAVAG